MHKYSEHSLRHRIEMIEGEIKFLDFLEKNGIEEKGAYYLSGISFLVQSFGNPQKIIGEMIFEKILEKKGRVHLIKDKGIRNACLQGKPYNSMIRHMIGWRVHREKIAALHAKKTQELRNLLAKKQTP